MLRCWLGIITLDRRHPGAFLNYSGGAGVLAPRRCSATMQREDETNEQIHSRCPTVTLTSEWFSATTNLNFEPSKSCPLYLLIAEASKHIHFFPFLILSLLRDDANTCISSQCSVVQLRMFPAKKCLQCRVWGVVVCMAECRERKSKWGNAQFRNHHPPAPSPLPAHKCPTSQKSPLSPYPGGIWWPSPWALFTI